MSCIGLLAVLLFVHYPAPRLMQINSAPTQEIPATDSDPTSDNTPAKNSASAAQPETGQIPLGFWTGSITLTSGEKIPLAISIQLTSKEVEAGSDELFSFKKEMICSFTIDREGGPYRFGAANFSIDDGRLRLVYERSTSGGTRPSLTFDGMYNINRKVMGDLISSTRGKLGTFDIAPSARPNQPLTAETTSVGIWHGTWSFRNSGDSLPFTITLEEGLMPTSNPDTFDLAFTPARIGSFTIGTLTLPLSSVNIDYLSGTIMAAYKDDATGSNFSLKGHFKGNEIVGTGSSSFLGSVGNFKASRQIQSQ
jgi:hypothetical protein